MITYGSVCSGIEAATTAWHPLGWSPRWFAEIEPFPSAVLAHHWPEVPNLGDFALIRDKIAEGGIDAPDILVGGTPCQAFSVAGLRQSMGDSRGQLTLEFVRLANAIDSARNVRGQLPVTVVWENVFGVLNTPDNAFGCFLAGLAGEDDPLVPPGGRWTNVGYVRGPKRAVAWRILDAQYFGVAQRRRRVFVVASAGGIRPEQVLFELEGVRRDSPPSREAGQGASADVAPSLVRSGRGVERPGETRGQDPVVAVQAFAIQERAAHPNLNAGPGGKGYQEGVAYTLEARHHVQACAVTGPLDTDGGTQAVAFGVSESPDLGHCLRSGASKADKHESTTYVRTVMQVRRLTPTEAERLQGFPDWHTKIPWRGKPADECPDGPRYKALGNSMAVPVMRWIGRRIDAALRERQP